MHYSNPWNHIVIDDFLSQEQLIRLQKILPQQTNYFRQDEDDEMEINYQFLPDIELAKYFLRPEFKSFLEKTTGYSLKLNLNSLVQLRMMTPDSPPMPPHVDNQDERSVVCILYVSPNWTKDSGGELCLLAKKEDDPRLETSKIIEPIENRMVLFCSEDSHWHSVMAVKNWIRHSIIMEWIICSEEK